MAQVGELATEMKAYDKSKEGSIFIVDRRQGRRGMRPKTRSGKAEERTGKEIETA